MKIENVKVNGIENAKRVAGFAFAVTPEKERRV